MKADLHCHTVLSDGAMRVDQIIPYAKRIGLDYKNTSKIFKPFFYCFRNSSTVNSSQGISHQFIYKKRTCPVVSFCGKENLCCE